MALTFKDLKNIANQKGFKDNAIITNEQLENFVHITHDTKGNIRFCKYKPIGRCNRTGEYVYPSIVKGYQAFCPELNEDLYEFEFTRINFKK